MKRLTLIMLALLTSFTGTAGLAQDSKEGQKKAPSPVNAPIGTDPKNDAQRSYIIYFIPTADPKYIDPKTAQERLKASNTAVMAAKKLLNGSGGMRDIVDGDLSDLAKNLPGGKKEAEGLKPILERGWHVLVIMDPDETKPSSQMVISPYIDVYSQIEFARNQDRKAHPDRYLVTVPVSPILPPDATKRQGEQDPTAAKKK